MKIRSEATNQICFANIVVSSVNFWRHFLSFGKRYIRLGLVYCKYLNINQATPNKTIEFFDWSELCQIFIL